MVSELGRTVLMPKAPTTLALKNSGGGQSVLPQHGRGNALVHRGMVLRSSSDSSSQTATAKYGLYDAQREFEAAGILPVDEKLGGVQPRCGNVLQMDQGGAVLNPYSGDGSELSEAKYVYDHWVELGAM